MCSSAGIFAGGALLVLPTFLSADVDIWQQLAQFTSTGTEVVLASDWLRTSPSRACALASLVTVSNCCRGMQLCVDSQSRTRTWILDKSILEHWYWP